MMETLSETEFAPAIPSEMFIPNSFVDTTAYIDRKIAIAQVYESEIQPHPFPRSTEGIRAQSLLRGAQAGCSYAESFMLLKEVVR